MSSYFNLASYARAKKNKDELQKSNPKEPVLKDEDEKFLERQISKDDAAKMEEPTQPTVISDDGEEKPALTGEQSSAEEGQQIVPETQPPPEEKPQSPGTKEKSKKDEPFPSQEEAEAATRGWNEQVKLDDKSQAAGEKKTWASYLPTMARPGSGNKAPATENTEDSKDGAAQDQSMTRSWTEYASAYMPSAASLPSLPSSWTFKSKDKDSKAEPVYKEDGTIDEEKTREKQEKEVSVLLDNLNMSAINNRVFAFSGETQKIYERFAQVLKDTMNGGPTAYEDMEKLMKEAGPTLDRQFQSMPPFVQTLVKALPAKLGTTLGPELVAAASEKPGADMKARMESASKGETYAEPGKADSQAESKEGDKKKKRTIPGMKSLISKEGAIAGMLRNTVNFLQTRFPFLASTTNVVMSLAVFILMFVFWYCHKRGREVRLAKAADAEREAAEGEVEEVDDDEDIEVEDSDETADFDEQDADLEAKLNQPDPVSVPLPEEETKDEKAK